MLICSWILIFLASSVDYGWESVYCQNGIPVECSGVDLTNLILGGIAAVLLFYAKPQNTGGKWGVRAAAAACVGLFFTAFDGVGCRCY